jgi:hypothetical protein
MSYPKAGLWQAITTEQYVQFFLSSILQRFCKDTMNTKIYITLFITLISITSYAQRLSDPNPVGWYNTFGTIYVAPKTSVWLEYQWRRDEVILSWQQSLARVGVQYHFKNGVSTLLGYGFILTYPFGDFQVGPHYIPEHRIFEQLTWNGNIGRLSLNHRLRLEQRFIGKVNQTAAEHTITGWNYLNRVRYQIRATVPLSKKQMGDKTVYLTTFDELFIGFGKNVNQNIFDQNRIGLLAGYQFNKTFRAELGVFNQTLQQGALFAGNQVYQYNYGIMANIYITVQ